MPTRHKGSRSERRALDAYIKLTRAAETVSSRLEKRLLGSGVAPTQVGILDALYHLGPMPLCDVAAKLLRSAGNITSAIDRLEGLGLVRRERDSEDRRVIRVHLTPNGSKLIQAVLPGHVAEIERAMSALTPAEQEELARLTKKLGLAEKGAKTGSEKPAAPERATARRNS
jgi:MarR family 2-MHQ and catechol resistance regulon transcriptional repressor